MPDQKKDLLLRLHWLPYAIACLGVFCAIILWYALVHEESSEHFLISLKVSSPWIALLSGIFIAILLAIATRLVQQTKRQKNSLQILNKNFQDEMSERMKSEETKQKLEKALLQGQKLQAIGTLAGGIAHDFNNILYAITGYTEMAREDVAKDSTVYGNLGKVLEASHRGQELISRILAFSRRHHFEFKPIHLKETIEGALSLLHPTIPASVNINFVTTVSDCVVLGNQTQLHQVIVNIINNAVDAMDSEGTVTLQLGRVLADDELLKPFPDLEKLDCCSMTIKDTGSGMDQATLGRIFEPFFTTKEVGKGTGLGLSTVHAIVKEHQGEIIVNSKLGQGTEVIILIPEYENKEKEKTNGNDTSR